MSDADSLCGDYSAIPPDFMVPLGPGLWRAHRSSSVIGTGMQKPGQLLHGELTELSVTGAQLLAAAAANAESEVASLVVLSVGETTTWHGAIVGAGAGAGSMTPIASSEAAAAAVKPEPPPGAPVSSTFVPPPPTRVNVNFGQTFKVESKVLE
ncbi:MAG TPA: hypothetical protein VGD41_17365 [Pyrinomonadaceae bacterium]